MKGWNKIEGLQRFMMRVHPSDNQFAFISNELSLAERGAAGEQRLEKRLKRLLWEPPVEVLTDLNLQLDDVRIQMDFLIATTRCLYVLESKNISGNLYFDADTEAFHRMDSNEQRLDLKNPKYQLISNIRFLRKWLEKQGISMPVKGAVCLTSLSSVICSKPTTFPLLKLEQIVEYLTSLHEQTSNSSLTDQQFDSLYERLKSANSPYVFNDICNKYSIPYEQLKKGVLCPSCRKLTILRSHKNWHCQSCGYADKEMHLDAIREYFLYTREPLTNKRFREFCGVESIYVANRLLRASPLTAIGTNRHRIYTFPEATWINHKN